MYKVCEWDSVLGVQVDRDATAEEAAYAEQLKQEAANSKGTVVREQRNLLLAATDWSQGVDVPQAIKDKYTTYRQALRDITSQAGFPSDIQWPTQPE